MNLAEQVRRRFPAVIRHRGADYFQRSLVEIVEQYEGVTIADVRNASGHIYETMIERDGNGTVIDMDCTCPYFDGHGLCKHLWATILQLDEATDELQSSGPNSRAAAGRKTTKWAAYLDSVIRAAALDASADAASPSAQKQRTIWYVIDVERSQDRQALVIQLQTQEQRTSGTQGKIKELRINTPRLNDFADTEHHQPLRELLECASLSHSEAPYSGHRRHGIYHQPQSYSQITLPVAAAPRLLSMMAATGQLRWALSAYNFSTDEIAKERSVEWDSGPAWKLNVRFQEKRKDQQWLIRGALCSSAGNGDQSERPLTDAILICKSGIVLFPESAGLFESSPGNCWLDILLRAHVLRIPFSEREEFVGKLLRSRTLSSIELPSPPNRQITFRNVQATFEVSQAGQTAGLSAADCFCIWFCRICLR